MSAVQHAEPKGGPACRTRAICPGAQGPGTLTLERLHIFPSTSPLHLFTLHYNTSSPARRLASFACCRSASCTCVPCTMLVGVRVIRAFSPHQNSYTPMHVHAYTPTPLHTNTSTYMPTCLHAYPHAYMHAIMHVYMSTCLYVYMSTHLHAYYTPMCMQQMCRHMAM